MSSDVSALLSVHELSLAYGPQQLLDEVTLSVGPGEKVGLVGVNGCGKTSLLRILAGANESDSGTIMRRRGLRVGYLPQEFELDPSKTVLANIEAGAADLIEWKRRYEEGDGSEVELSDLLDKINHADGWHLESRIKAEASALFTPPLDTIVGPLSGGEKRRVALCRALASQPDLLLLDEPTNHLDSESIGWLEEFLKEFPGAVIFVTHDRYFLDVIATRIIEISNGRAYSHPGNYTAYLESKAIRQQIAEQSERRRQRFLRVELEWVRAGVRAQRSKSSHRLDSFYATAGLEAPPEEREMDLLIPPPPEIGNLAVDMVNAGAKVGEGESARWLFRGLKLSLRPGTCTGIVGRNGVGKTTLLRLCLGERQPDEGTVAIGKKAVFNYIDQGRMHLDPEKTVMTEIGDGGEYVVFGDQKLSVRAYLRRFLFADDRVREQIGKLSGGERARLMLAKVLKRGGNVIVLDEPTNDLDLPSLRILEEALVNFEGTVIVVSHDRYFLDRICDQIVAFEGGEVVAHLGNFSSYLERKKQRDARSKPSASSQREGGGRFTSSGETLQVKAPVVKKLSYKEQRELEGMEATILEEEKGVAQLEALLHDPSFYTTRSAEAPQVIAQLEKQKAKVAQLYVRWEELGERSS